MEEVEDVPLQRRQLGRRPRLDLLRWAASGDCSVELGEQVGREGAVDGAELRERAQHRVHPLVRRGRRVQEAAARLHQVDGQEHVARGRFRRRRSHTRPRFVCHGGEEQARVCVHVRVGVLLAVVRRSDAACVGGGIGLGAKVVHENVAPRGGGGVVEI